MSSSHIPFALSAPFLLIILLGVTNFTPAISNLVEKPPWTFSAYHLAYLAQIEPKLVKLIRDKKTLFPSAVIAQVERELERFRNEEDDNLYQNEEFAIDDLFDESSNAMKVAFNPIKTYKMIWRYTHILGPIIGNQISLNDDIPMSLKDLPNIHDLREIQNNILRLSEFYRLNATLVCSGSELFGGEVLPLKMSIDLGNRALKTRMYTEALKWFTASYSRSLENGEDSSEAEDILESVDELITEHDELYDYIIKHKLKNTNPYLFITKIQGAQQLNTVKEYLEAQVSGEEALGSPSTSTEFELLCRGEHPRLVHLSNLTCWYQYSDFPPYALKVELHSREISLIEIHEFVGKKLRRHVIQASADVVTRATLFDKENYKSTNKISNKVSSRDRISAVAFLDDAKDLLLQNLASRIEKATGLKVSNHNSSFNDTKEVIYSSEPIQIVSYAFGGHYKPHFDVLGLEQSIAEFGDRLATFMIYLSDVQAGGFTVFPDLRLAIAPKVGSAIFWYNMKKNGQVNKLTFHGACPVALGRKIVANKWILEHQNFLTRNCDRDEDN